MDVGTGSRIRQLRLARKLSQRQLAGSEMSREFISMVENGKCSVSPKTLSLLASRLGVTTDYLLRTSDCQEAHLAAEQAVHKLRAGDSAAALSLLQDTLFLGLEECEPSIPARIHFLLGHALRLMKSYDEALDHLHIAQERLASVPNSKDIVRVHNEMGCCLFEMENYKAASRHFARSVALSERCKSLLELHVTVLVNQASNDYHLGRLDSALAGYSRATKEAKAIGDTTTQLRAGLGQSALIHKLGDPTSAKKMAAELRELSTRCDRQFLVEIMHNWGIFASAEGHWEEAMSAWRECLLQYMKENRVDQQVALLEEIAGYMMHRHMWAEAERTYQEALGLLNSQENLFLRGGIYRALAILHIEQKQPTLAREYLRLGQGCFHLVKAEFELQECQKLWDQQLAPHESDTNEPQTFS